VGAIGRFLVPEPLPKRLLYVERLRRRMRVRFGGIWIADSEQVLLLFEPGRYPVAYFPETDVSPHILERTEHTTQHTDLGLTSWYSVRADEQHIAPRGAWQHTNLPAHANELQAHVAFAWRAMDAFYEEDERIVGHAADPYHRIGGRLSRLRRGERAILADTPISTASIVRAHIAACSFERPRVSAGLSQTTGLRPSRRKWPALPKSAAHPFVGSPR
jgi:uncharacterized protein (DUF427 family)